MEEKKEGSKFGWGVLGFFIPLVGFILFTVWIKDNKKAAKASIIGAIIGVSLFLLSITMLVLFGLFDLTLFPKPKTYSSSGTNNSQVHEENKCKLYAKSKSNSEDKLEALYGYYVKVDDKYTNISNKCDNLEVVDSDNNTLFYINFDITVAYSDDGFVKVYTSVYDTSDDIDDKDIRNFYRRYAYTDKKDIKIDFYMPDSETVIIDANYPPYKMAKELDKPYHDRILYIYQPKSNNKFMKYSYSGEDNIPWYINDFEIDDEKNIIIYKSIYYPLDGVNSDKYRSVMKIKEMESNPTNVDSYDPDSILKEYNLEDYTFIYKYVLKKNAVSTLHNYVEGKAETYKTYKEIFNEKKLEIKKNN